VREKADALRRHCETLRKRLEFDGHWVPGLLLEPGRLSASTEQNPDLHRSSRDLFGQARRRGEAAGKSRCATARARHLRFVDKTPVGPLPVSRGPEAPREECR